MRNSKGQFIKSHKFNVGRRWKLSPEQRAKLIGKRLGRTPWNKGKTKKDCPQLRGGSGHSQTKEARIKIGMAVRNRVVSLETREKMRRSRSGSGSYFWKGGKTALTKLIRANFKYRQWRSDVFTRDDYICQLCGQRGGQLEADHIKRLSDIICDNNLKTQEDSDVCSELWNINNGRTLCLVCHKKTDTYGRPKNK